MADRKNTLTRRLLHYARPLQLQLVLRLAESGSLLRGAQAVGLSQPAATQALARLEAMLDMTLFERHARGVRLTPLGRALLPTVQRAVQALEAIAHDAVDIEDGASGRVRVVGTAAATSAVMAPAIVSFCAAHPDMVLEYQETSDAEIRRLRMQDEVDAFLCRSSLDFPPGYVFTPLQEDRHGVFCATSHPLARRATLTLSDCRDETWTLPPWGTASHQAFMAWCATEGLRPKLARMSTRATEVSLALIEASRLLYVGPVSMLRSALQTGRITQLALTVPSRLDDIGLWYLPDSLSRATVHALVTCLTRQSTHPWPDPGTMPAPPG